MSMNDGQEFEDRNLQLPADPRPVAAGARPGALDRVPLGTPDIDFDVRSVFDVRPVNGFDFVLSTSALASAYFPWTFTFTVPIGLVAVVRSYEFISDGVGLGPASYLGELLRDGVNFPYNAAWLGPAPQRTPTYMLVDEQKTFGVRVTPQYVPAATPTTAYLTIFGTFLLKTGRAYPYEIANPVGVIRRSVLAPEPLYTPTPPAMPIIKEITREVVREIPSPAQQQPASPPASTEPVAPPFEIKWIKQISPAEGSCPAGNGMYWVPTASLRGGRSTRNLTLEEVRTYERWIALRCPPPDNASAPPARGQFTRSPRNR